MNYINHEESGYGIDLDLLTISYESSVSNSRTHGLIEDVTIQGPSTLWDNRVNHEVIKSGD